MITVFEGLSLDAAWNAEWEDRLPGVPQHTAEVGLSGERESLSGSVSAGIPLAAAATIPRLDVELRYEIARDVEARVYAGDILAPGLDDGRSLRGIEPDEDDPFIGAGAEVGFAVRVSF